MPSCDRHPEKTAQARRSLPTKISKTTPCKVPDGRQHGCFWAVPPKHFDTSGKSAAQFHHRAICKNAHTAATWLMQLGTDPWEAADYLGMSVKVLIDTYGHHHPDYMKEASGAITRKRETTKRVVGTPETAKPAVRTRSIRAIWAVNL